MNQSPRTIDRDDRSGVLRPDNLSRFDAQWIVPAHSVREVVDTYWSVNWSLPPGDEVHQQIIDFPAITFSIEEGDVPAAFVVSTVRPQAWARVIRGTGAVFAIRLRPAGLGVLSQLDPLALAYEAEITSDLDESLFAFLGAVAAEPSPERRAQRADALISEALAERSPSRSQLLANASLDAITATPTVRSGHEVAVELGASVRTLQRAMRSTVGIGPNEVGRRIRLQEVVRRLSTSDDSIAAIAAELGYTDQAHLINEFRGVSGTTPGRYVRSLRDTALELQALG